jgi:hypothetical protein
MRKVDEIVTYLPTFFPKSFSTMVDPDPEKPRQSIKPGWHLYNHMNKIHLHSQNIAHKQKRECMLLDCYKTCIY